MSVPALVLAHQGGWDELLLAAIPLVLFIVLLRVAARSTSDRRDHR